MNDKNETIVFGGGCFWCTEAIFLELKGVISVAPGYAGGITKNPTYIDVSTGNTGHVEVIKIEYNKDEVKFNDLLTVFFATHDPTTLNRQGNDLGTQYRSVIFYTTEEQKKESLDFIRSLDDENSPKIVTEVAPLDEFYIAEDYHKNYYENNKNAFYCQLVINPKLEKLQEKFKSLLKNDRKNL